jgi:hypothetical protein
VLYFISIVITGLKRKPYLIFFDIADLQKEQLEGWLKERVDVVRALGGIK